MENFPSENVLEFCEFLGKSEYIWKDEWTSAIHFVKFLHRERKTKTRIVPGEFDCWPKRFLVFLKKINSKCK